MPERLIRMMENKGFQPLKPLKSTLKFPQNGPPISSIFLLRNLLSLKLQLSRESKEPFLDQHYNFFISTHRSCNNKVLLFPHVGVWPPSFVMG